MQFELVRHLANRVQWKTLYRNLVCSHYYESSSENNRILGGIKSLDSGPQSFYYCAVYWIACCQTIRIQSSR
jgi:hypothetical protein